MTDLAGTDRSANDRCRNLVLVLGDQLSFDSGAFDGFQPSEDRVWMAEVDEESEHVPSHKARIALFLTAMRHFAQEVRARGWPLEYLRLGEHPFPSLAEALADALRNLRPRRLVTVEPGDWRVRQALAAVARNHQTPLEIRPDRCFVGSTEEFARWAAGRRNLVQEHWYRQLRRKTGVLMEGPNPVGGRWNFDAENRASFGPGGPGLVPRPVGFPADRITSEVLGLVARRFEGHPGSLEGSIGRSRAPRRSKRSPTSSETVCPGSAGIKTPCGTASRSSSTADSRRR